MLTEKIYENEKWIVDKGKDGYIRITYFDENHYCDELILHITGEVKVTNNR